MSWVNLDDVYVNKSGDSIAGNLSVGGALTINDGKGTDTTYNVANEITTLRDSVSQTNGHINYTNNNIDGEIYYSKINDILFITIINCYVKSGYTTLCTLPQGCRPTGQIVFAIADNVTASVHESRYGIIKANGEVIIKANANGEHIWTTTATILNL